MNYMEIFRHKQPLNTSLKRLSLHEGQVLYQYGKHGSETESMDYP